MGGFLKVCAFDGAADAIADGSIRYDGHGSVCFVANVFYYFDKGEGAGWFNVDGRFKFWCLWAPILRGCKSCLSVCTVPLE